MTANSFDANFYAAANPDLASSGLTTNAQLLSHFQAYGLNEGRAFSQFADLSFYRANNSDLARLNNQQLFDHLQNYGVKENRRFSQFVNLDYYRAVNSDLTNFNSEQSLQHLQTYGLGEGRQFSEVVDLNFFRTANSDLPKADSDNAKALQDLEINGIQQGREFSPVFSINYYKSQNSDLTAAKLTNSQLLNHFEQYGLNEGRQFSSVLDVNYYKSKNSDLTAAKLTNSQLLNHFKLYGLKEGRASSATFNVSYYLSNNSDLKAAKFTNAQAFNHFLIYGQKEKRSGIDNGSGTQGGGSSVPKLVTNIKLSGLKSNIQNLTTVFGSGGASTLYFTANDGSGNTQLWTSDGTKATQLAIADSTSTPGTTLNGSNPQNLTNVGSKLYFTANDGVSNQLWTTDGTAANTKEVQISDTVNNTPLKGSNPKNLTTIANSDGSVTTYNTYFTATDGKGNNELWTYNGTNNNATLVKDGSSNILFNPDNLRNVNNNTLCFTTTNDNITQLWSISGGSKSATPVSLSYTPAGSNTALTGSNPRNLTGIGGKLYLIADDGTNSNQLWTTDGTTAGTKELQIADSTSTPGTTLKGSSPQNLTNVNNTLYFTANDGTNSNQLWTTDGTTAGTKKVQIKDTTSTPGTTLKGSNPQNWTPPVGGTISTTTPLYFTADDGVHGNQLWKYDGSNYTEQLLLDSSTQTSGSSPQNLTNVNGTLYFTANDATNGNQLWSYNTTSGIKELSLTDTTSNVKLSNLQNLTNVGGKLNFTVNASNVNQLWSYDTAASSSSNALKQIQGLNQNQGSDGGLNPDKLTNVNGKLYFTAKDGKNVNQLWTSDGTSTNTAVVPIADSTSKINGSNPDNLTDVNGKLYFTANDAKNVNQLWMSDGKTTTQITIKDNSGASVSNPQNLTSVNGKLYFTAPDSTTVNQLWSSDGTTTTKVSINGGYNPQNLTIVGTPVNGTIANGKLYFTASDTSGGTTNQLWMSDGTATGTMLVKNFSSGISRLTDVNGKLYFTINDPTGNQLWMSDGTSTNTARVQVRDNNLLVSGFKPDELTDVNGKLYFTATNTFGGTANQLWTTDGTATGTILLKNLTSPDKLTDINGKLYFTASDQTNGNELWMSDGTSMGTMLVKDINLGLNSSTPDKLTDVNGKLYFTASNQTNGNELWMSDGTATGTMLVKDIYSGSNSSTPDKLTNVNGKLYFTANDGVNGTQLWVI